MSYYDLPYFYQQQQHQYPQYQHMPMQPQSSYLSFNQPASYSNELEPASLENSMYIVVNHRHKSDVEIIGNNIIKKQLKRTISKKRPPPPKLIKEKKSFSSFNNYNSPELKDHFVGAKNSSDSKSENSLKQSIIKASADAVSESEPDDECLCYISSIENRMRKETAPIEQPKNVKEEPIPELDIPKGIIINQEEINNWQGDLKMHKLRVDQNPEVIHKTIPSQLEYEQEIFFKFLRTMLPPDGDIILREEPPRPVPAPPLIVRIPSKEPDSKPDVIHIYERPPTPPAPLPPVVIPIKGKDFPLDRKVIKETIDPLPTVPLSVLIDKWLPYMRGPRRVVFEPNSVLPNVSDTTAPENTKNLTIHIHFNEPVKRFHRSNSVRSE